MSFSAQASSSATIQQLYICIDGVTPEYRQTKDIEANDIPHLEREHPGYHGPFLRTVYCQICPWAHDHEIRSILFRWLSVGQVDAFWEEFTHWRKKRYLTTQQNNRFNAMTRLLKEWIKLRIEREEEKKKEKEKKRKDDKAEDALAAQLQELFLSV